MILTMRLQALSISENSDAYESVGYNDCNMKSNGEVATIKHLVQDSDIIFDIGANKGEWLRSVLNHKKIAKIYAFEPIPQEFKQLKKEFKNYPVAVYNYAISSTNGAMSMYFFSKDSALSSLYYRPILCDILNQKPEKVCIKAKRLDGFCSRHNIRHINFIKIDTEGAELEVLRSCEKLINAHAIDYIQFEYGGCYLDSNTSLFDVYSFLIDRGYYVYRILPDRLLHIWQWSASLENFQYSNYLASRTVL